MNTSNDTCTQFEACEKVAAVINQGDSVATNRLAGCMDKLYAEDCCGWLISQYGYRPTDQATEHAATEAFGDAVQILFRRIKNGNFEQHRKPNACRRFIYAVSRTIFKKSQHNRDIRQSRFLSKEELPEPLAPVIDFPLEKAEKIRNLHTAINKLPEEYRAILTMRFVDDCTIDEIARKTALTSQQVNRRLFTGREKLKKIYNHD